MIIHVPGEFVLLVILLAFWGGWEAIPLLGMLARRIIRGRFHD